MKKVKFILMGILCISVPTKAFEKFPICTAAGDQVNPRISGDYVVWTDRRGTTDDIYGYNLITDKI